MWRRRYCHATETGLYYLQSRYYDPVVKRFINADELISTAHGFIGYNTYAYCNNNPVISRDASGSAVETVLDVISLAMSFADVAMNPSDPLAWLGFAGDVIDLIPVVTGVGELVRAVKTADRVVDAVDDVADTAKTVDNVIDAGGDLVDAACFVAGTPVKTASGEVSIEDLKSGDIVWAWNEETGEISLKSVKNIFINESDELVHLTIKGETITTTPSHPFYVAHKGWYAAVDLRAGDILVLVNGEYVTLEKTQHEILEAPITVYNFEVEDYHTYYVGTHGVLVHNMCMMRTVAETSEAWNTVRKFNDNQMEVYEEVITKLASGDTRGLNVHRLSNGNLAADLPGYGKGRGRGRVIYQIKNGIIEILEVSLNHYG